MELNTKGRYAVMAMADLARYGGADSMPLSAVAERQKLSLAYLEQLFQRLRRAGLVASARGRSGGYVLARPAASITVAEIMSAVDEDTRMTRCRGDAFPGCLGDERCLTHGLWDALGGHIAKFLSDVTLQEVIDGIPAAKRPQAAAGKIASDATPRRTYLDYNASAPLRPEARQAMIAAIELCGNPSSPHEDGRRARAVVEDSRERIAHVLRARPSDVFFTSGATEAANWVLTPATRRHLNHTPVKALLLGATEHACVLQGHRFSPEAVEFIPVDGNGVIDLAALETQLTELSARHGPGSAMVAVQAANNETGVLQPVKRIAEIANAAGAIFVCDAVQLAGRAPCDGGTIAGDILFLSSHKIGGPQGAGVVAFAGDHIQPEPLMRGGGQERRQRSGTENAAAIAGLAAALDAAIAEGAEFAQRAQRLQQRLETGLRDIRPDTVIFGEKAERLPNTTCFAVPGLAAETALIALDLEGVAVSSGSACSSGKVGRSHVLDAMGVAADRATAALRVSTGWATSEADIDAFLAAWRKINARHADRRVA